MKIAVLGMGTVGETIGTKLVEKGHQVMIGSRSDNNPKAIKWAEGNTNASYGTFSQAAIFSDDIIFNCIVGEATLAALETAGILNFKNKILIDLANPLDFSNGMPPTMFVCNDDSLGEQIQRKLPDTFVVKTLNTMNCTIMLNPSVVPGNHSVFVSGNSSKAKNKVKALLESFNWSPQNILDLGDITTARGTEMMLPMWIRLWGAKGNPNFNFHIQS
jgi:8-hydroxy-5-deazaflavin:NADPH oxidoreductase